MTTENDLIARSGAKCELCGATEALAATGVPPHPGDDADTAIFACATCRDQIAGNQAPDAGHWRCLADSMWTPVPAVQVCAWRMLKRFEAEAWAHDLLDQLYLDEETLAWAASGAPDAAEAEVVHLDGNGAVLAAGDTVILIKDLKVKGANFTAKRGTAVRGIALVRDNPLQIEGRVEGQQIVILTEFVKKSG
jgi:protein PhnA